MRFLIISPRSGDDGSRLSLAALWLLGKGQRQTFVLSVFSQVSRPHFLFLAPFIFFLLVRAFILGWKYLRKKIMT